MDYKRIVKSRQLRFKLLRIFQWVPDSIMLRIQYYLKFGFFPNFKNPQRYSEKMQLYKIKYRNPVLSQCVDKYEVRKYIEGKGLSDYLVRLFGVYDKVEDIIFDELPDKFVLKNTTGGGGISVIIVDDKSKCNWDEICKKVGEWPMHFPGEITFGREWAYTNMAKTRILIEELLEPTDNHGLIDYKFICFNGRTDYLYVMSDRAFGRDAALAIYDRNFNKTEVYEFGERRAEGTLPKPKNFLKMVEIAKKLSEDFPQVRVDLYNVDGKIYFGELTFYDESGYTRFDPDSFDFELGKLFDIESFA